MLDKYDMEHGAKEQEGVNQNWLPTRECFRLALEVIGWVSREKWDVFTGRGQALK